MAIKEDALIVAGVAVALVGLVWYAKNKITSAAGSVVDSAKEAAGQVWDAAAEGTKYVNPAEQDNVANQIFTGSLRTVGVLGANDSVGTKIYDVAHMDVPNPFAGIGSAIGTSVYDWTH